METRRRPTIWYRGHKNAGKNYGIFFSNLGIHVKTFENLNIKVQERAADLHGISQTLRGRLNLFLSFIAATGDSAYHTKFVYKKRLLQLCIVSFRGKYFWYF